MWGVPERRKITHVSGQLKEYVHIYATCLKYFTFLVVYAAVKRRKLSEVLCDNWGGRNSKRERIYVCMWLIYFVVQQKLRQYFKVFILKNKQNSLFLPQVDVTLEIYVEESWIDLKFLLLFLTQYPKNDIQLIWLLHLTKARASQVALVVENIPANAGDLTDMGLILESGRSPGGGHSNPIQYSCLENPIERGAWWAIVHRVTHNWTRLKWLSMQS